MGATGTHRDKGIHHDDFFRSELPTTLSERGEILASAAVGIPHASYDEWHGVYYAAVRQRDTGEVWALVILYRYDRRDYFNFTYKDMSESMGPGEATAPAKVLSLLTPTDNEWATAWRERCRANLARRALASKVTPGARVRFTEPIKFTNGAELGTLTFVERDTFADSGGRYRLTDWRQRDF